MWSQGSCYTGLGHWFPGHWIGGFFLNTIIIVTLAFLLYKLIQHFTIKPRENCDVRDSLVILEQRLTEGKISPEDYRTIRNVLGR